MSVEKTSVSSEFQHVFDKVYPYAYGDHEKKGQFISLIRNTVEAENFGELKYMVYSLREIGTHASISPSSQMADFSKWLKETDEMQIQTSRKYNNMLANLIKPENLPIFNTTVSWEETSSTERANREMLAEILFANLLIIRKTGLTRVVAQNSATAFLESDVSDTEIGQDRPGYAQYLATNLIINSQTNRQFLPIWETILYGKDLTGENKAQKRLLKQSFHMGFHGLMSIPTREGDFNQIAFDVAPQALKVYVQILDKLGDEKQEWFGSNLLTYCEENRLNEFKQLMELSEWQTWPDWAKEQVKDWEQWGN